MLGYKVQGIHHVGRTRALRANKSWSYFDTVDQAVAYAGLIHRRTGVIVAIETYVRRSPTYRV